MTGLDINALETGQIYKIHFLPRIIDYPET